jgi:hypothetical protein
MEDSDQDVQEIDPPVLNRTKHKKYHWSIFKEPLDPYFCRRGKRNTVNQQTIDVEDDSTPAISDLITSLTTEDAGVR